MTLPQNVKKGVAQLDNAMMFHADDLSYASWTAIRAHLLSQDAEIERLQSRLAAAKLVYQRALGTPGCWEDITREDWEKAQRGEIDNRYILACETRVLRETS
jgi:hypothetical protein